MAQRKTIVREREEDGALEFVDAETGEVTGVQKQSKFNKKLEAQGKKPRPRKNKLHWRWKKNKNGTPLLLPYDFPQKDVDNLPDDYTFFRSDSDLCLNIALMVANGYSLNGVAKEPGYPPVSVIFNWYYRDPIFKGLIDEARKMRAEFYHDRVHDIAEKVKESTAKSSKVQLDAYKHLMQVNDRERFGQQTKVVGHMEQTVTFVIDTGIHDEPIPVEGKTIETEHGSQLPGEGDAGTDERLLAVDGSDEP